MRTKLGNNDKNENRPKDGKMRNKKKKTLSNTIKCRQKSEKETSNLRRNIRAREDFFLCFAKITALHTTHAVGCSVGTQRAC